MNRLEIVKLVGGGRGLAHHDGDTWLVAGALPGETVNAVATGRRRGIVEAEALTVTGPPHPARDTTPCPHAVECGGCDWPHVQAAAGAALKAGAAAESARVSRTLAACLAGAPVRSSPLAYRLRCRLHWDPAVPVLGFYRRQSWDACAIDRCRIVSPRLAAALPSLAAALAGCCPVPADLEWLEELDGSTAVAGLRAASGGPQRLAPGLVPTAEAVSGAVDGFHLLSARGRCSAGWGADGVRMELPIPLEVPLGAFFQGNRHLVPWLFARVGELAGEDPLPAWDLHAGVGLLAAAALARAERRLVLVEPFHPAAEAAARNLPSAEVVVGRTAEAFLARQRHLPSAAVVLTDPPRAGMTAALRQRLAGWHPRRIVMLGCDAATWARDAAFLLDRGYRLAELELVDLFPSTHHVEIVAVLEAD